MRSITYFEELSNDIFYEIFDYLDIYHTYQAFYHLNHRFHNLLDFSILPINIHLSFISKSTFYYCYEHIILRNPQRIFSLFISNIFIYRLVFSLPNFLQQFIRLEKLTLMNIQSTQLTYLLRQLSKLPNLHSLVVVPFDELEHRTIIYQLIFDLPVLKYCKLSFQSARETSNYLLMNPDKFSPIEYLVIHNETTLGELNLILAYVPYLRRLSWHKLNSSDNYKPQKLPLKHLTNVSLEFENIDFDDFQLMITNLFHHLEILQVSITSTNRQYLDPDRWEELISNSMPNLHTFDFEHRDKHGQTDDLALTCMQLNTLFTSPFWCQHQWFFTHRCIRHGFAYKTLLYSTNPYRRRRYQFYEETSDRHCFSSQETNFNAVRHVHIGHKDAMKNQIKSFPNATELTLSDSFDEYIEETVENLNSILRLTNLTKLYIDSNDILFRKVLYLLQFAPHIEILKIYSMEFFSIDDVSIEESELFQFVSNRNVVKNLTITQDCTYEQIKLVMKLFSQLQYLNTDIFGDDFHPAMDLLLSKQNNNSSHHLFSLCFNTAYQDTFNGIKHLIQSNNYFDDYSIMLINNKLYLWWK